LTVHFFNDFMTVSTRLEAEADEPFLRHLIIAEVAENLMASSWPEAIRDNLLDMQYRARRSSIRANFPQAESLIVLLDGRNAGWLVVARTEGTALELMKNDELRVVEIMLLPEHRGKGIGSKLIRDLLLRAERAQLPLRLSVDVGNTAAIRLYEKLGFRRIGSDETRHFMEVALLH
jgi:ribosomal protein S18 acetylase RimI-like enzyme